MLFPGVIAEKANNRNRHKGANNSQRRMTTMMVLLQQNQHQQHKNRWKVRHVLCYLVIPACIVFEILVFHRYLFIVTTPQHQQRRSAGNQNDGNVAVAVENKVEPLYSQAASLLRSNFLSSTTSISQNNYQQDGDNDGNNDSQQHQQDHDRSGRYLQMSEMKLKVLEKKLDKLQNNNIHTSPELKALETARRRSTSSSIKAAARNQSDLDSSRRSGSGLKMNQPKYQRFIEKSMMSPENSEAKQALSATNAQILQSVGINISQYNDHEQNYIDRKWRRRRSQQHESTDRRNSSEDSDERIPDGTFNGYPIYRITGTSSSSHSSKSNINNGTTNGLYSNMHCIGETWSPPKWWGKTKSYLDFSWQYRSCHYEFFCYDTHTQEFVLYLDAKMHKTNNKEQQQSSEQEDRDQASWKDEFLHAMSEEYRHNTTSIRLWDVSQTIYDKVTTVFPPLTGPDRRKKSPSLEDDLTYPYGVSIGSINSKWTWGGIPKLQWFPTVRYGPIPINGESSYPKTDVNSRGEKKIDAVYTLPSSVVMIPFHSLAASNPGHLVWDDFLPIYTLMQIFGFDTTMRSSLAGSSNNNQERHEDYELLMLRYILPPERKPDGTLDTRGLWAGCDWRDEKTKECNFMLNKFASLMTSSPHTWNITSQKDVNIRYRNDNADDAGGNGDSNSQQDQPRALICAKNGLAGIGSLSDHGSEKGHGWEEADYKLTYNHGRGGQLYRFRNFMMRNIGVDDPTRPINPHTGLPMLVFFSENSSAKAHRSYSFEVEQTALKQALEERSGELGLPPVEIQSHLFKRFTVQEQALLVSQAAVYVTACGGGAVTAAFLPRGSSLIMAFSETGGIENNKHTNKPARLDWDYLNNLSYLRVQWLPQAHSPHDRSKPHDIASFVDLVLHELQVVYRDRVRRWEDYQERNKVE